MALPLTVAEAEAGVEEELRRLVARELHDRVAQTLTGMLVDVENFKSAQVGWQEVVQQLDLIQTSTRQVLASIRQLLHDLRGEDALQGRFIDVVRAAVARFEHQTGIAAEVQVSDGWPQLMNSAASLNIFRIVEEALANVRMHSGARKVSVVFESRSDNEMALSVSDDGRGVDTDPLRPAGLGTIGMRERAVFLGGRLWIESQNGRGATVRAIFPRALLAAQPAPLPETITLEAPKHR